MLRKGAIQSALARLLVRNKTKSIEDLVALCQTPGGHSNSLLIEMHELFLSFACGKIDRKCFANFPADVPKPRYIRVNTLKMDVDSAVLELGKQFVVLCETF